MSGSAGNTTRLPLPRFLTVWVCIGVFAFLPFSQLFTVPFFQLFSATNAETTEGECPYQNDGEATAEELLAYSATRRRADNRHCNAVRRSLQTSKRLCLAASHAGRRPGINSHQLSNGCSAPLRI
ncbi:hypothetical protein CA54_21340 [Symmachiella macrocystis]|uniref:Uncharacterized protein n=1 Tax=Symmachiella macrocystis TaxID=2527985 RepID=A0A5C6BPI0_9PLAN|nr:hypothetical protein [Symmachiella macrocystis]TWU13301.1 hypothetical protein CA54_21340 [Symmachiella macrocystis]